MKPFNLEQALAGRKVMNALGEEITQIHKFDVSSRSANIAGVLRGYVGIWGETDMFMEVEKKEGWVNLYHKTDGTIVPGTRIWDRKDIATRNSGYQIDLQQDYYVATVKIEWEE